MSDNLQIPVEQLQVMAVKAAKLWATEQDERLGKGDKRYWHPYECWCHQKYFDDVRGPSEERIYGKTYDAFQPLFQQECFKAIASGEYPELASFRAGRLHAREFVKQLEDIAKGNGLGSTVVWLDTHSKVLRIMFNVPGSDRYGKGSRAQSVQLFNPRGRYLSRHSSAQDAPMHNVPLAIQDKAHAKLKEVLAMWKQHAAQVAQQEKWNAEYKKQQAAEQEELYRKIEERRKAIQNGLCEALGCHMEEIPAWALGCGSSVNIQVPYEPEGHVELVAKLVKALSK